MFFRRVAILTESGEVLSNGTHGLSLSSYGLRGSATISGLSSGSRYRLIVSAEKDPRLWTEDERPLEIRVETRNEELTETTTTEGKMVMVLVEASEQTPTTSLIPMNDPIRLLPIIGMRFGAHFVSKTQIMNVPE